MIESTYLYQAYGLTIQSEINCPELEESPPGHKPDVRIQQGPVPESLVGPKYSGFKCEGNGSSLLIRTDRIAKLLISGGNQIFVQNREGAHDYEIRTLLLGWGLGAVLHQRGILPLHASAVATDQGCLAFCGPTGIGKSALAWAFLKRGYRLLDDNIAALKPDVGIPMVFSGYPEIKLWGDVLGSLSNEYPCLRPVLHGSGKFALDARDHFQRDPQPLIRIYVLSRSCSLVPRMTRLKGGVGFRALSENTFCARFLRGMGQPAKHFDMLAKLADHISVFNLEFPANSLPPDDLAQMIEESLQSE
jgi:hypothetical protein